MTIALETKVDMMKGLAKIISEAYDNAYNHGFWDDYETILATMEERDFTKHEREKYELDTKLSKMALVVSEIGEAIEGIRKPGPDQHCPQYTSVEIELADAIIRIADFAGRYNLRLSSALLAKMEYNQSRPRMHGKGA